MREQIIDILKNRGESFLDDRGVDASVCASVADEIMEQFNNQLIVVAEQGGMCQDVMIEGLGSVEFERLDWDCIQVGERIELSEHARTMLPNDLVNRIDEHNRSLGLSN